jgi:AraC-like DNA-binding protein
MLDVVPSIAGCVKWSIKTSTLWCFRTTPFHLARIFREHVGVSVHEYNLRLRLMRALPDLLDTDRGITEIALDHGFSSHSHFTYAFRRRAGLTPNELRRIAKQGTRREVSKIVIALSEVNAYII